jgi:hypothetical protein
MFNDKFRRVEEVPPYLGMTRNSQLLQSFGDIGKVNDDSFKGL